MTDTIYVLQCFDQGTNTWTNDSYTRSLKEAQDWCKCFRSTRCIDMINEYVPDSPTEED